jgi:very-short-patch-repair endonuclease
VVGGGIFDLALPERKVLVEFDGPNHVGVESQRDEEKDTIAKSEGWQLTRIAVPPNTVIPPSVLRTVLRN